MDRKQWIGFTSILIIVIGVFMLTGCAKEAEGQDTFLPQIDAVQVKPFAAHVVGDPGTVAVQDETLVTHSSVPDLISGGTIVQDWFVQRGGVQQTGVQQRIRTEWEERIEEFEVQVVRYKPEITTETRTRTVRVPKQIIEEVPMTMSTCPCPCPPQQQVMSVQQSVCPPPVGYAQPMSVCSPPQSGVLSVPRVVREGPLGGRVQRNDNFAVDGFTGRVTSPAGRWNNSGGVTVFGRNNAPLSNATIRYDVGTAARDFSDVSSSSTQSTMQTQCYGGQCGTPQRTGLFGRRRLFGR